MSRNEVLEHKEYISKATMKLIRNKQTDHKIGQTHCKANTVIVPLLSFLAEFYLYAPIPKNV